MQESKSPLSGIRPLTGRISQVVLKQRLPESLFLTVTRPVPIISQLRKIRRFDRQSESGDRMTEDDNLGRLYDLDDRHLLHTLAFEMNDYIPEAQYLLKAIQTDRGISDADIVRYRRQYFANRRRDAYCDNCDAQLVLEQTDLEAGWFTCPECGTEQLLSYPLEEYDDSEDTTEADAGNTAEPKEGLDSAPTGGDSQSETADSGVVCAYCDKELQRDQVCVVDGEFYCTECLSDEKKRVATIEEPTDDRDEEIQRFVINKWSYVPFLVIAVALVIIVMQLVNCLRDSH